MVSNRIDDRDAVQYPLHVLREYALLADGERGALVGPRGDMVWLCAPRWDSDAVFSSLIGGGGLYAVTPRRCQVRGELDQEGYVYRFRQRPGPLHP